MSTSSGGRVEPGFKGPWSCCGNGSSARWSGINIAAMVFGFIFFWPVGLVVLFWILSGRHVQDLPNAVRELWNRTFHSQDSLYRSVSDNVVFNDYQQTQFDRIREIKQEIKTRAQRFADFRSDAKRRADQAEFEQFMAGGTPTGSASRGE